MTSSGLNAFPDAAEPRRVLYPLSVSVSVCSWLSLSVLVCRYQLILGDYEKVFIWHFQHYHA